MKLQKFQRGLIMKLEKFDIIKHLNNEKIVDEHLTSALEENDPDLMEQVLNDIQKAKASLKENLLNENSYSYQVTWLDSEKEYIALCSEFPSLSFLSKTKESALKGLQTTIKEILINMQNNGEKAPSPRNKTP